jgi:predicted chitinase
MATTIGPSLIRRWTPVRSRRPTNPVGDPWAYWTAEEIAAATGAPLGAIRDHWPAIYAELAARGVGQREVQAAAIATIAVETAHTFAPVEEAFWMSEAWRWANLIYDGGPGWWGRGYIQLTHRYNYETYGKATGFDLAGIPNLALLPDVAAAVLAEYFVRAGVAQAAQEENWPEVRRKVQGADAGLEELLRVVRALGF